MREHKNNIIIPILYIWLSIVIAADFFMNTFNVAIYQAITKKNFKLAFQ